MGRIGEAFGRELGPLIRYDAKVTQVVQDNKGVTVTYVDSRTSQDPRTARADWCLCTIPLSILAQIPMNVGPALATAISSVPYASAIKVGLQFKRRFWEQDDQIYGGITYTDLPITNIAYPNTGFLSGGKGVLLGAYIWGMDAMRFTAMAPAERVRRVLDYGSQIHPQYHKEFDNGVAVAWHRSPFTLGCFGMWNEETRTQHYAPASARRGAGRRGTAPPAQHHCALLRTHLNLRSTLRYLPAIEIKTSAGGLHDTQSSGFGLGGRRRGLGCRRGLSAWQRRRRERG
jgi:monoamine oxidase